MNEDTVNDVLATKEQIDTSYIIDDIRVNKKREYNRKYYYENRERLLKYQKKWESENRESCNKNQKKYREKNPELQTEWRKKNPEYSNNWAKTEKGKANNQRGAAKRQAREKNIINTLTAEEWIDILKEYKFRCAYCGKEFTLFDRETHDHVIPISKGGDNTKGNIVPACKSCNSKKHDKLNYSRIE